MIRFLLPFSVLTLLSASALAQSDDERARVHYAEGRAHADAGDYPAAHADFRAGYELSHRPLFLFNMAESSYLAGETHRAQTEYARYLAVDPSGSRAPEARARLHDLSAEPAPSPDGREVQGTPPILPTDAAASAASTRLQHLPEEHAGQHTQPLRRNWKFWAVVAASIVAIGAGVGVGVAASRDSGGGPRCADACSFLDLR